MEKEIKDYLKRPYSELESLKADLERIHNSSTHKEMKSEYQLRIAKLSDAMEIHPGRPGRDQ